MKTITLMTAIALALSAGLAAYHFVSIVLQLGMKYGFSSTGFLGGPSWLLSQAFWIVAQVFLAVFLFKLYSRQND